VKRFDPTPGALVRASAVVARSIAPGQLSPAAAQQRNALIRDIAWELDKLVQACRPESGGGEAFRKALTVATDALTRFEGPQAQEP